MASECSVNVYLHWRSHQNQIETATAIENAKLGIRAAGQSGMPLGSLRNQRSDPLGNADQRVNTALHDSRLRENVFNTLADAKRSHLAAGNDRSGPDFS
jgi:hypothetical protein